MYKRILVPNHLMDSFWHAHILDTRNYEADCKLVFGEYLHHYPYLGRRGTKDFNEWMAAFRNTKRLYLALYGESMDAAPRCANYAMKVPRMVSL